MGTNKKESGAPCPVVLLDFSGIYETENFHRNISKEDLYWVNVRELSGTNCYCDDEAKTRLLKNIRTLPLSGIHFLDSGNYHYMTRLWLTLADQPFRLLVFDNHTDLQPPAFGNILSCGGWIESAMRELPDLREVTLIGPDEASYAEVASDLKERIRFLGREKIAQISSEDWFDFFKRLPMDLPWYLSVDKDILCREDARTAWSQGELSLNRLLDGLQAFQRTVKENRSALLGIDVCGECDPDSPEGTLINDRTNLRLLEGLKAFYA